MIPLSLSGKVAVVTGGSRGIGKATALGFARAGADVAVVSRKQADLEKVAEEIRALGRRSLAVPAHLGKVENIKAVALQVKEAFGRIDILVNSAAANPAMSTAIDTEELIWDKIMDLNLKGVFFLAQAVARVMKEQGGGSIINVSSRIRHSTRSFASRLLDQQGSGHHGDEGYGEGMGKTQYPG